MAAKKVFSDYLAAVIADQVRHVDGVKIDQPQQNALFGAHQLRVTLLNDATVYRLIIAPADAPVMIGSCPVDAHFIEPLKWGAGLRPTPPNQGASYDLPKH